MLLESSETDSALDCAAAVDGGRAFRALSVMLCAKTSVRSSAVVVCVWSRGRIVFERLFTVATGSVDCSSSTRTTVGRGGSGGGTARLSSSLPSPERERASCVEAADAPPLPPCSLGASFAKSLALMSDTSSVFSDPPMGQFGQGRPLATTLWFFQLYAVA